MVLNGRNSMRSGSDELLFMSPPDLSGLDALGYWVYPVSALKVIFADPAVPGADVPLEGQPVGPGHYGLVISGTFRAMRPGQVGTVPVGPVMRNGQLEAAGLAVSERRGAVAVLDDDTVVVARCDGTSAAEIRAVFSTPKAKVREFLGGGALLIEDGRLVPELDLIIAQGFAGKRAGFQAPSMESDFHAAVGIIEGHAVVVVAPQKTARALQEDCVAAGFGALLKLERGNGFYFFDGERRLPGRNVTGLAAKVRKHA